MQIRLFSNDDTESITDLLYDMSIHYNGANASPREAVRANLLQNILGPHSGVDLVVAVDGDRVVGMATISLLYTAPKEQAQRFMKELYVHSANRGAGIGEKLMQWLARYALENRCSRFDWTVDEANAGALRFYSDLGATQIKDKMYFRFAGESLRALGSEVSRDA